MGGPCPKARAGRYTPRRLLLCARRPGPAPLCPGNERPSGAACSSPGVPNRRRRPWRSPGGCRRRQLTGSARGQGCLLPAPQRGSGALLLPRPDFRVRPTAGRRLGLVLLGEIGSRRAFSSLNVTLWRVPTGFFFLSFFLFTTFFFSGFSSL